MKNNLFGEILLSIILIGLLVLYLPSLQPMMPRSMHTLMLPLVVILFIFLAAFFWRETPGDERQQLHRFIASRFAYFAGTLTLIVGIIYQSLSHTVDSWLIIALSILLLAKILGSFYSKIKK